MTTQPHVIDKSKLPPLFPTHRHDPAFWCSLGRAVATFGFLEEMLKRAVLALKGTVPAPEEEPRPLRRCRTGATCWNGRS